MPELMFMLVGFLVIQLKHSGDFRSLVFETNFHAF